MFMGVLSQDITGGRSDSISAGVDFLGDGDQIQGTPWKEKPGPIENPHERQVSTGVPFPLEIIFEPPPVRAGPELEVDASFFSGFEAGPGKHVGVQFVEPELPEVVGAVGPILPVEPVCPPLPVRRRQDQDPPRPEDAVPL
jgi:hypothetical protein